MPRLPVAAALTLLSLTACSRTMDDSDIKQNPHPEQAYEITVTIRDAPGPFEAARGDMRFQVANSDCVPRDPVSGGQNIPSGHAAVTLNQTGPGIYRGTVYLDMLQDSNYFGLGTCRWRFDAFVATFSAYGVLFEGEILGDQIRAEASTTQYVAKELFRRSDVPDLRVGAVPTSDYVRAHHEKFFSITLTARERHDGQRME